KGHIENPRFYFNENEDRKADLDALMLTQGWRNYKYARPYTNFNYKPETSLSVSGIAISKSAKNNDMPIDLTMMTFGKEEVLYTQTTDSLGRFNFALDDEFGSALDILIQSTKKSGKKVDYNFNIDEKKAPEIAFNPIVKSKKPTLKAEELVEKEIERKRIVGDIYIPEGNIALDEVLITGRNLSPAQEKVIKRFGEPDRIIDGDEIKDKEKSWSSGIFDILHYNFQDKVRIINGDSIVALNLAPTMVVVDGIPVFPYEYGNLKYIPASEVTSIEVIELAKFYKNFCFQVYASEQEKKCIDPKKGPQGNIVAIYTKAQIGINGAYEKKLKGISKTTIPVFAESKNFYAPKYDKTIPENEKTPDLRTLIHW